MTRDRSFQGVEPDLDPLRPPPLPWDAYEAWLVGRWRDLLGSAPDEPTVQEFLEHHPCLLPGANNAPSSAPGRPRGDHGPCWSGVVRQPELKGLGRNRFPDFMWIQRDSAAVRPVLVEIEDPQKPWFNPAGRTPNAKLTQALDQLVEWKVWFSSIENQLVFRTRYVPPEFRDRRLEPEYVLVYGRDAEFRDGLSPHRDPSILRQKRDFMERSNEYLFTYDRLAPERLASNYVTLKPTPRSLALVAVPPTLTTGPATSLTAALDGGLQAVIRDTELISAERKQYLIERWEYWRRRANSSEFVVQRGHFGE